MLVNVCRSIRHTHSGGYKLTRLFPAQLFSCMLLLPTKTTPHRNCNVCCSAADNAEFKRRIAVALSLLVTSKLLTIQVGVGQQCVHTSNTSNTPCCAVLCCSYQTPTQHCQRAVAEVNDLSASLPSPPCLNMQNNLAMCHHCTPSSFAACACMQVPFFFKHAVDALSIDPTGLTTAPYLGMMHLTPVALLLGYGISRCVV